MATLEAEVSAAADAATVAGAIKRVLADEFAVGHATVEIGCGEDRTRAVP